MTASKYPDDGVGEVFLKLGKQGSTLAGVMDAFSMAISVGLQYGIPLESYVAKFTNMRFEPAGMTDDAGHPDGELGDGLHLPPARPRPPQLRPACRAGHPDTAERTAALAGEDPAAVAEEIDPEALAQSAPVEDVRPQPARAPEAAAEHTADAPLPRPRSSTELIESQQGRTADAPLCLTCGTKMRPAGSCYVCEGCGSTSGCS